MERLTSHCGAIDKGETYYPVSNFATGNLQQKILNNLGAYEDTELTPEEIQDFKSWLNEDREDLNDLTLFNDIGELARYRKTGLTPDEIGAIRLDNKFLQNQNKEFREEILKLKEQRQRDISELQDLSFALIEEHEECEYWEREAKKWCDKGFNKELKCYKIEKEHNGSTLMNNKKIDLIEQIMCLEHNNNVLYNTINQQVENFKTMQHDAYNNLDRKSFKVDLGHNETDAVRLVDIEEELIN